MDTPENPHPQPDASQNPQQQSAAPAAGTVPPSTPQPVSSGTPQVSNEGAVTTPPTAPSVPPSGGAENAAGTKKTRSPLLIIAGLILLLLIGLGVAFYFFNQQLQGQQKVERVAEGPTGIPIEPIKTLVIGTDATYPPMEFEDDTKTLTGYDIDLGNQIAAELGGKAEFKNIPWDNLFQALEKKEVDVIMSSVTINEERQKQYLFSSPYINAGQVILTKKDIATITSATDLQGKKVGVQKDTTSEQEAKKYTDPKLVTGYADYGEAAKNLVNGKLDAIVIDLTAGKGIVDKYPTLKIASDPFTNEYYGIVLRKGDKALQGRINQAISSLQERGVLDDIKQEWFQ